MVTTLDISLSRITTPDVFRHTPFEHETTTDSGTLLTTAGTAIITTQRHSEDIVVVPVRTEE